MIVYIHGASATHESFNYIREHIGGIDTCLEYQSDNGFENNLHMMADRLKAYKKIFFICHSLGGIYALHLAERFADRVQGAITLSTPYGGSRAADYAKYFLPFSRLMRDIGPKSYPMNHIKSIDINWPWLNVVSTKGASPFIPDPNDGVVTIESMRHLQDKMDLIDLEVNHYEVVISPRTVDIIKQRLDNLKINYSN
jgi:pimeloyl-ACP methyl ester carboxylesterase